MKKITDCMHDSYATFESCTAHYRGHTHAQHMHNHWVDITLVPQYVGGYVYNNK